MTGHRKQVDAPQVTDAARQGCTPAPEIGKVPAALRLDSTITCPQCGSATRARMPTDACQFFWDCPACGAVLKPKPGDCCVFCSWGDVPCPPIQANRDCCGSSRRES